ncbi:MAG: CheR family methyltransferase [Spirochaetales bacterium]
MSSVEELPEGTILVDISDSEFQSLSALVYQQFGINLTDKKKALVRGRLNRVLRNRNLKTFREYLDLVQHDPTGLSLIELIDRISTNHTFFFREADHFTFLIEEVLPGLLQQVARESATKEIRLWCAGCATGEEAYTLAMLCHDFAQSHGFAGTIKLLATDISVTALEAASKGQYNDERIRLIPETLKKKYLTKLSEDLWAINPVLKSMVLFKRLNFMDQSFPFKNRFHVIFCRNVMIYFDRPTKNDLVSRLSSCLYPGHYFFIGHSETLGRDSFDLDYVKPSVYKKRVP